jgi:GntR family transcriptional regulator/MocR family aminotransferase
MKPGREVFVPEVVLDRAAGVPLQRQIYGQIAEAIRSGLIGRDARLPSTRVMARLLGVSRNTVLAAYEDLTADDLVRGERGAGMRVHGRAPSRGLTWFGLRDVIRAAGYPARILTFEDPDGNPLYIRH